MLCRYNWSSLVILVPVALWVLHNSASRPFALNTLPGHKQQGGSLVIPDLIPHKQSHLFADFRHAPLGGSDFASALAIDIVIHIIDVKEVIFIYLGWFPHLWTWLSPLTQHVNRFLRWSPAIVPWKLYILHLMQSLCNTLPQTVSSRIYQDEWDWSLWFLHNLVNHVTFFGNIIVLVAAVISKWTLCYKPHDVVDPPQFLLPQGNLSSLRRTAEPPNRAEDFIVLDFCAPDHRLGLGKVAS